MKRLQIFRAGKHTAMSGEVISFSAADLRACVDAYDPKLHEAPIVVGHPKDNAPAYGWISKLSFAEGGALEADPAQVDPAFAELVEAGRFKKVSASFYLPDSPQNPKPGSLYLRHVGFLGAQAPAVKGLRDASFAASEDRVVEFADWNGVRIARLFRGLRELVIKQFGQDAADTALPSWDLESLTVDAAAEPAATSSFTEPSQESSTMSTQTAEQLAQREAEINRREQLLNSREASFGERETRISQTERTQRRAQHVAYAEQLLKEGKLPPAQQDGLVAFMDSLEADGVVEFGEGDKAMKQKSIEWLRGFLSGLPKVVDYSERGGGGAPVDMDDAHALAVAAQDFQEAERKNGRAISVAQAMEHVTQGRN